MAVFPMFLTVFDMFPAQYEVNEALSAWFRHVFWH